MTRFTEVYEAVQAFKEDPFEVPRDVVERVAAALRKDLGLTEIPTTVIAATLDGMVWTIRLCNEHGLDMPEVMDVIDMLRQDVTTNISRTGAEYTPEQLTDIGIGAGFWTGLAVGLRYYMGADDAE